MYLSKLTLNPRSRQVMAELNNVYELHRTVMQAFPDDEPGRVLFRVDERRGRSEPLLLVQSQAAPDWAPLAASDGYLAAPPAEKEFHPEFRSGQTLVFRLLANPTVRRNGSRQGILDEDAQIEWLERKGRRGGFAPAGVVPSPQGFVRTRKGGHQLTFYSVRFDGHLTVREPETFRQTVEAGIGSGKAFGFGLLSVAPAP